MKNFRTVYATLLLLAAVGCANLLHGAYLALWLRNVGLVGAMTYLFITFGALYLLLPAGLSYIPYLPPTEVGSIQQMIYGLAMVLLMVFRPGGLWGFQEQSKGGT